MFLRIFLAAPILLFGINSGVFADDTETMSRIDEQLAAVQTMRFGQGGPAEKLERTLFQLPADSPLRAAAEQKLIDALDDANELGTGVICRQLRVIGSDRCVPRLAKMLGDPERSSTARYALQGIGSEAALKAMHDALEEVSDELQIGLLNSLSARRYEPMRDDCIDRLQASRLTVATAAARALGKLGDQESVAALRARRPQASDVFAADIDLALLDCAESLLEHGDAGGAADIYQSLFDQGGVFRLAGLRGLVKAEPDQAADRLVEAIGKGDDQLAAWAINLSADVPGQEATRGFVAKLGELAPRRKALLLKMLGVRGDAIAVPAVTAATANDERDVRLSAIEALGSLQGDAAVDALLSAATGDDHDASRVARASLIRIASAEARLEEVAGNTAGNEALGVEAIAALASRASTGSTQLMIRLARCENRAQREAAIRAAGMLGDATTIASLVALAKDATPEDRAALEIALGRILLRIPSADDRFQTLSQLLPPANSDQRPMLIRLLSKAGTAQALDAVRVARQSSNPDTADAAVQALSTWPSAAAKDDLIELAGSARTDELKKAALDGLIRIAAESDAPTVIFREALLKSKRVSDRKRILNEIGLQCESFEALETTQSLWDDPTLKAVAAIASVRIAYKLRLQHRDRVREIIEEVLIKVDHSDVQKRARDVLNDLDKYQDHILTWVVIGPLVDDKILSGEQSYRTVFDAEKTDTSGLTWKPLTLGIGSWDINLEATYGAIDHCSAVVRTMVWSPIDQDIQVEGGSDDALRIWVNGKQVHDQWRTGGCDPRQVRVPARLNQGWNELKLKVTDHEGGWQFGCRVRKPDGTRIDGLKFEAR